MKYRNEDIQKNLPVLDRLCHLFNFRRKEDRNTIANLLNSLDTSLTTSQARLNEYENLVSGLKTQVTVFKDDNTRRNKQITLLEQTLTKQQDAESELRNKLSKLDVDKELTQKELQKKMGEIANLLQELDKLMEQSSLQAQSLDELQQAHYSQSEEIAVLRNEHHYLTNKFSLISEILSAKAVTQPEIRRFKELFSNDFLNFANREATLSNEAEAVMFMQDVMDQLELAATFPRLFNKTIGAIGGGFSSGKSAFLNSFFQGNDIELPVGITPVTSLPCYVVANPDSYINGHARNGGIIPIALDLFNSFTPEFFESFSFNIRDIMPMVSIGASLNQEYFQHVCIIDTPGYNPASCEGFRAGDKQAAISQLQRANFIIWMIGLDTNGTIPKSDIEYLSSPDLEGKDVFVVLNKADLKAPSERDNVMKAVEESLYDWDIPFVGISAYSASEKKEYTHNGVSLFDFLRKKNQTGHTLKMLKGKIETVFSMYQQALSDKIAYHKDNHGQLHSLKLDMLEMGIEDTENQAYERISNMQSGHRTNELQEQLQASQELQGQFLELLDKFADSLSMQE
jgi:GTPase involved in cell partitioning and DNA repair